MTDTNSNPEVKKKSKIKSLIYRIFLIVIAGLTVGLSFFSWNATRVVGNQLPMPLGFGVSVVLTGSMEPTLKVNDLVFITEADEYQENDIVVYQRGNELIIHRIVRIGEGYVLTKGDANNAVDDPITLDMIKGKFSFRIPIIGFVFKMIKTLPGTLLILALVVFLMYRSRSKERRNSDEELEKIAEEIRQLRSQQQAEASSQADSADPSAEESAESAAESDDGASDAPESSDEAVDDASVSEKQQSDDAPAELSDAPDTTDHPGP